MDKSEYHINISFVRTKYQKGINDLYIWTTLIRNSMQNTLKDDSFFTTKEFIVPSKKQGKILKRNPEQLKEIIQDAHIKDILQANFVYVIAQYESFFQELYSNTLAYTTNLSEDQVDKKVLDFTFLPPLKQFDLYEQYIEADTIENHLKEKLIEFKASRDLIVHNDSTINQKYISKADSMARGTIGDSIKINIEYFEDSFATIKSIIGQITSKLQRDLK